MNKASLAVHFSSKTDDWATPQDLFDKLNAEHGPLMIDVCASVKNRKAPYWFGEGSILAEDGLATHWDVWDFDKHYTKCWMNPPYGREIGKWIRKAYEESLKGCLVVALLPARVDTRWFHDFILDKPSVGITFLRGRLKFGGAKNCAPFPSMVVVFKPGVHDADSE